MCFLDTFLFCLPAYMYMTCSHWYTGECGLTFLCRVGLCPSGREERREEGRVRRGGEARQGEVREGEGRGEGGGCKVFLHQRE